MPDISYRPFNNFKICLPKNKPTKDIIKVTIKIIEACNQTVAVFDKPACNVTPAAKASIAVTKP